MAVAGVDGIKGGWLIALKDGPRVDLRQAPGFRQVLQFAKGTSIIAIDMPIGLSEAAAVGGRECDRRARKEVDPGRGSTVFPTPCRPALMAKDYDEAKQISRDSSAARLEVSVQTFALFGKLREVDEGMTAALRKRCFEVHPEVSFTALRDKVADDTFGPLTRKARIPGRLQRLELLQRAGFDNLNGLVTRGRALGAKPDDVLDACVAAWTAERIAAGTARRVPEDPPRDARGLRMEIWF